MASASLCHRPMSTTWNHRLDRAFEVFTDLRRAAERVRGIERLELLTEGEVGAGTRFRETRVMFKKEAVEEMEITAFEPPRSMRVEADSCGAHFRTVYRFTPQEQGTLVEMELESQAHSLFAKLMSPLSRFMVKPMLKCLNDDMDDLAKVAES